MPEIADLVAERGAWLHVDGAFGLWAQASPALRALTAGVERADSWATDAHKWLNVPYDNGFAICAHPAAHRAAMSSSAPYLVQTAGRERDPLDWVPEFSRRGRGFTVWAALRCLGRSGVRDLIERGCAMARRMAERLAAAPGVEVLNDVVLNQVLVRFTPAPAAAPMTPTTGRARSSAACRPTAPAGWAGTTWHGMAAMRISVSNWSTSEEDIDRSAAAILRAAALA